jgi:hypothetical protein
MQRPLGASHKCRCRFAFPAFCQFSVFIHAPTSAPFPARRRVFLFAFDFRHFPQREPEIRRPDDAAQLVRMPSDEN